MSERVRDEEIERILQAFKYGVRHCATEQAVFDMAEELRERRAADSLRRAEIDELVRRRNADLSADDVDALREWQRGINRAASLLCEEHINARSALVDRIVAAHGAAQ